MSTSIPNNQLWLFDSVPERVKLAIVAYANETGLSTQAIITIAIAHFLEAEAMPLGDKRSYSEGSGILDGLPASLQDAINHYAAADKLPPEFVVELAIAHFLDPDSVTFDDCQPGIQHERVELLRQHKRARRATAA